MHDDYGTPIGGEDHRSGRAGDGTFTLMILLSSGSAGSSGQGLTDLRRLAAPTPGAAACSIHSATKGQYTD